MELLINKLNVEKSTNEKVKLTINDMMNIRGGNTIDDDNSGSTPE